jgi:hypothetical protein
MPTHPECRTIPIHAIDAMLTIRMGGPILYAAGVGLSESPDNVTIEVEGRGTWYHHDSKFAFEWKRAAEKHGFRVAVYVNR